MRNARTLIARSGNGESGQVIQSVTRALQLLEALNRRSSSSVADLSGELGLPKPTVVRILNTLRAAGYVGRDEAHRYRVKRRVEQLSRGYEGRPQLVEVARPLLYDLTARCNWPAALALPDGNAMTICASSASISTSAPFYAPLGMRLDYFAHGLGMAYLAYCSPAQRARISEVLGPEGSALVREREEGWLEQRIEQTRRQGFARRDPGVEPSNSDTLAMPVLHGTLVVGSIGITFFRRGACEADIAVLAAELRATSAKISEQLAQDAHFSADLVD